MCWPTMPTTWARRRPYQGGRPGDAVAMLDRFAERHPGSLFVPNAPVLLANAYLASGDPQSALRGLQPLEHESAGSHVDFRLTLAKAYQAAGDSTHAGAIYSRHLPERSAQQ